MSSFIQFAAISLKPGCHRNTLKTGSRAKRNGANSIVQTIPMSLLERKSCSAKASMISESHLHCTKVNCRTFFCKIDRLTVLVKMTVLNSERKNCKERYYTNLPFRLQFPKP